MEKVTSTEENKAANIQNDTIRCIVFLRQGYIDFLLLFQGLFPLSEVNYFYKAKHTWKLFINIKQMSEHW